MKTWLFLWIVVQLFNLLHFSDYILLLLRKILYFPICMCVSCYWFCLYKLLPIPIMFNVVPRKTPCFPDCVCELLPILIMFDVLPRKTPCFPDCVCVSLPVLVIFNVLLRKTPCFPKCVCTVTNPVYANCYRFRICSMLSPGKPHVLLTVCMCVCLSSLNVH